MPTDLEREERIDELTARIAEIVAEETEEELGLHPLRKMRAAVAEFMQSES